MKHLRLSSDHEAAMEELLLTDIPVNIFLLAMLEGWAVEQLPWFGALDGDTVRALLLVLPGHIAVPFAPNPEDAAALSALAPPFRPNTLIIGPREASDALMSAWAPNAPIGRALQQRLYTATALEPQDECPGLRVARPSDEEALHHNAIRMEIEDLGFDPSAHNPEGFRLSIQRRIYEGRTWVVERDGVLVFHIHVGAQTAWGVQIGGTYVPPSHRGQGIARAATADLTQRLLRLTPLVTLHVNEANLPAVRVYERVGFHRAAPFRLITSPGVTP